MLAFKNNKKGGNILLELLPAVVITIIIVLFGLMIFSSWFVGFISDEAKGINTIRGMSEAINDLKQPVFLGPGAAAFCNDFKLAIMPGYQVIIRSNQLKIFLYDLNGNEKDKIQYTISKALKNLDYSGYVCSPEALDGSEHTLHCPNELIINRDYENRISGTYCACAAIINKKKAIIVYPKGISPFCSKGLDIILKKGSEKIKEEISEGWEEFTEEAKEKIENYGSEKENVEE